MVELLAEHYAEWERMAQEQKRAGRTSFPPTSRWSAGPRPAAGFEACQPRRRSGQGESCRRTDFLSSIAAARQEVQALFEISQDLGNSLSLDETLSVLAVRLAQDHPASFAGDLDSARTTC